MKRKKTGFIAWAMRYHNITNILVVVFVLIGVFSLVKMPRNEFPQFTIRQGLVIGVYPGASSNEVEQQLTKQVENYLFGYKEVKKAKTYSESKDGMMIVYVELNDDVKNADEFWSKLKHGLSEFKSTLPPGVVALMANSDFGDVSAMLITLSSKTVGYKDMEIELNKLKAECRKIPAVSKIKDYGIQREKIYVNVEPEKLNEYNIKTLSLFSTYQFNGMVSPTGKLKTGQNDYSLHFPANFESEKDLSDQIVYADPNGGVVRLKDIAKIERRSDQDPDSYIRQNGEKTILLSLEMQPGNNIVDFGKQVQQALTTYKKHCPQDIDVKVISNLPQYVDNSISNFLREFLLAIIAVIFVVMLLLPKKVASIAGLTVPIAVFITIGILNFIGVQLDTVSLAGLIVVLGMIVDNSIVVIDNYVEKKDHGMSSWHAAIKSSRELVTPIITATLAICVVYIPFGILLPGTAGDFVKTFPVTVCVSLGVSVLVALFVVPFLNFFFIKKGLKSPEANLHKKSFLDKVQSAFDAALEKTFKHPKMTIGTGVGAVILGLVLFGTMNQQLFPTVERNQFTVEVNLDKGASLESTSKVMEVLEHALEKDKRVTAVTSFIGTSSPRFHAAYAPNMPSPNFGQLMVNTTSNESTKEVCEEYDKKFSGVFPNAHVKWKILALQPTKYPIEIRISGDSIRDLRAVEAKVDSIVKPVKGIKWIHSDWEQKQQSIRVDLDKDKAIRMGYSKGVVATSLMVGLGGIPLTTIWEGDYPVSVELKQDKGEKKDVNYLGNQTITSPMSFSSIPLRSFAKFSPEWTEGTIVHRNGTRTLTVQLDLDSKAFTSDIVSQIKPKLDKLSLPDGVNISYGGESESQVEAFVPMGYSLLISIIIIFFILLFEFKKVKTALLIMTTMLFSVPGAAIGLFLMRYSFSLTAFMGISSLCGMVVRNGIIYVDYLEELRTLHGMGVKEAALAAGKRRMRPIFLTSAAASVGVIPMILSRSTLWGPLGAVICFGLLASMVLTLFVLPVLYTVAYKDKSKVKVKKHIPYDNVGKELLPVLILVFAITVGSSIPVSGTAQTRSLSVDSCKQLALMNNKKIREAGLDVKSAQEQRKQAFTNYFPKVSVTGIAMKSSDYLIKGTIPQMNLPVYDGNLSSLAGVTQYAYFPQTSIATLDYLNTASLSVTMPLYAGGRIRNGNKLAALGEEVSKGQKSLTETEVLVRTEELYWTLFSLYEKEKTLQRYQTMLDSLYRDVSNFNRAGMVQRNDLLKVQLKKNELETNMLKLKNGITMTTRALCQQIGITYDSTLLLVSQPTDSPMQLLSSNTEGLVTKRTEYQLLNKAVAAEKLQQKMTMGEYLPQLAITGTSMKIDIMDHTQTNNLAFVSLSIPISDWWEGSHKIKQHRHQVEKSKIDLKEKSEMLALQINQLQNEVNELYSESMVAEKSMGQAGENLKVTDDNYRAGVSGISDLLEAQALVQSTKDSLIDIRCKYQIAMAKYLQSTGSYE